MSIKETSKKIGDVASKIKEDVKAAVTNIGTSLPRPILDRKPFFLRESLLKRLREIRNRSE